MKKYGYWVLLIFYFFSCSSSDSTKSSNKKNNVVNTFSGIEETKIPSTSTQRGTFTIQVAAFKERSNAKKLVEFLQSSGFHAYINRAESISGGIIYRVRVNQGRTRKDLQKELDKIKKMGYQNAYIVHVKQNKITFPQKITLKRDIVEKRLTFLGDCLVPQWSPDGREIAFFRTGDEEGIYSIGSGGGPVSLILKSTRKFRVTPRFAWSPSGKKIACVILQKTPEGYETENLYIIEKENGQIVKLLDQKYHEYQIMNLRWSPDEYKIAFEAFYGKIDAHSDLYQDIKLVTLSGEIFDIDKIRGTQRLIDWLSPGKLMFLSTYDNKNYGLDFVYQIMVYSIENKKSNQINNMLIKNCQFIKMLPGYYKLLYTQFTAENPNLTKRIATTDLIMLDTNSGYQKSLFSPPDPEKFYSKFWVKKDGEIYFFYDRRVWMITLNETVPKPLFNLDSPNLTLSPSGLKLCLVRDGDLFMKRLDAQK